MQETKLISFCVDAILELSKRSITLQFLFFLTKIVSENRHYRQYYMLLWKWNCERVTDLINSPFSETSNYRVVIVKMSPTMSPEVEALITQAKSLTQENKRVTALAMQIRCNHPLIRPFNSTSSQTFKNLLFLQITRLQRNSVSCTGQEAAFANRCNFWLLIFF